MEVKKPRRVVISISIPDELLERMDRRIEAIYPNESRSKYIEKLITNELSVYELITNGLIGQMAGKTDIIKEDQKNG